MRNSLKKSDVTPLFKLKSSFKTRFFILKMRPTEVGLPRVSFAFSRHQGGSVARNRFKRRIRELVRAHLLTAYPSGGDVLCIAKANLNQLDEAQWKMERSKLVTLFENGPKTGFESHRNL